MQTANLLVSCSDQKGLVNAITGFLYLQNANLVTIEQHIEDGMFFMRVEWDLDGFKLNVENFGNAISELQKKYAMHLSVDFNGRKKRLGLFCSKDPHCLMDILIRQQTGELNVEIPFVISNFEDCRKYVENLEIPFYYTPTEKGSLSHEKEQIEILKKRPTDVLALARYMKVISSDFIENVEQKIINVHHSFLPSFIGARPYHEAYERGVKLIGATSHYVTPELDQGPIIEQTTRRIHHAHKVENLQTMGRESEKEVFAFAIKKHIENKILVYKNRTIVFA